MENGKYPCFKDNDAQQKSKLMQHCMICVARRNSGYPQSKDT